jgi:formylmethanofuran dehydrogenase subunit C
VDGAADFNGGVTADHITIDGDAAGHLYFVDPSTGEIQDSADLRYEGGALLVTGSMEVSNGISVLAGGMTVAGDRLEVTGSFGLLGNAALDGDLDVTGAATLGSTLGVDGVADFAADVYMAAALGVSGSLTVDQAATLSNGLTVNGAAADFNADVTANKISIDGDVAKHLYIVDSDGSIKDEDALWFDGSKLYVTGSLETSSDARVGGDLTVAGNDILDSADEIVLSFKSINSVADSVEVAHNMEVKGDMFYAVSGSFSGDLTVVGDLTIQGSMTYIDTENLKVKDTLIHLNVAGNSNLSPRGIVLHGDQAYDDLAFGAKPASGDFIFAKEVSDADVDEGNSDVFAAAKLAAAWMGEVKLGGVEGSLSGSLAATATGAELSSTAELSVAAADDLLLSANGETAISFIESGEYAAFNAQFPGSSLVAAIVAAGGNFKQDSFLPGAVVAGTAIDFEAALGIELRSASVADVASKKIAMDVYLNGVRLAYGEDYTIESTKTIELTMSTMEDDRILVAIHNAA